MQCRRCPERKFQEPPGLAALSHLAWAAVFPAIFDASSGMARRPGENGRPCPRLGSHSIVRRRGAAEGAAYPRVSRAGMVATYAAGIRKIVMDVTFAWRSKRRQALR